MKTKRQKLYRYVAIIVVPFIIGLLSYPFHKSEDFQLFKSLKNKESFRPDQISPIEEIIKNKKTLKYLNFYQTKFYSDNQHAIFIDARSAYDIDYEKIDDSNKVIPNAINISVEDIDVIRDEGYFDGDIDLEIVEMDFSKEWQTVKYLESLPKYMLYIVYCGSSECDKSESLANYMVENFKFKNIFIYKGGWEDWKSNLWL